MKYMYGKGVVYCGFKLENVFVNFECFFGVLRICLVKIVDFGMIKVVDRI